MMILSPTRQAHLLGILSLFADTLELHRRRRGQRGPPALARGRVGGARQSVGGAGDHGRQPRRARGAPTRHRRPSGA